jgi:serine/threonine protein kinase
MLIYNPNSDNTEPIDDKNEDTGDIYRKYIRNSEAGENEWTIVNKLFEFGKDLEYGKNLIKILHFSEDEIGKYYDTNVVDTYFNIKKNSKKEKLISLYEQLPKLNKTRRYLQNNGIAYIDWKLDNIGLNSDGEIVLYDFDSSGIFRPPNLIKNIKGEWINTPANSYNYKYATTIFSKYSCENYPQNLDTFLFRNMLFNANNKHTDLPKN